MNSIWAIILSNAVVATLLAMGAALLGRVWKNPAAVHVVWLVVLIKLFTPPLFTAEIPIAESWFESATSGRLPANLSGASAAQTAEGVAGSNNTAQAGLSLPASAPSPSPSVASEIDPRTNWSASSVVVAIWICGVGVMALRYGILIRRFATLVNELEPAPQELRMMVEEMARKVGLKRVPEVLMTSQALPPLVWSAGTVPRIILPATLFARLDAAGQETVIAHELVHIRRRDHLVRLLELAATTVYWWHPVVWWACWKLRDLEEQCCDSRVLEMTPQHSRSYASALVETLEYLSEQPRFHVPLPTAVCSTGSLFRRIRMLPHGQANRLSAWTGLVVATLVALPLVLTFAVEAQEKAVTAVAVLRGRVQDEAGQPLGGVLVRVAVPAQEMRFFEEAGEHKRFEAKSDGNGDFRVEIPGVAERTAVSIDAMKAGYRRLSGTMMRGGDDRHPEVSPGTTTETTLKLPPALYFKGIVEDEMGKPIAGVEVSANADTPGFSGGVERTLTNQDGQFELFNYPSEPFKINNEITKGKVFFTHLHYLDRITEDVYAVTASERTAMRVVLSAGHKLAGTVRDVTGKPVPGVMIKAEGGRGAQRKATLTDAAGRFELRGNRAGENVVSVLALDLKQKIRLPIVVDRDQTELDVRLQPMSLPPNPKSLAVLGMKLTDLTPELKKAYDRGDAGGALILDPGQNSERLMIGKLAQGYNFWAVGNERVANVRAFVERILAEAGTQDSEPYSIRVVYSMSSVEFDGTNTQYLELTKNDLAELKVALDQIKSNAP